MNWTCWMRVMRFLSLAIFLTLSSRFLFASDPVVACVSGVEPPPDAVACVIEALGPGPADTASVRRLALLLDPAPSTLAAAAARIRDRDETALAGNPSLLAALYDLEGSAQDRTGRHDAGAVSFRRALELDTGVSRAAWYEVGATGSRWSAAVGIGRDRWSRAARSFHEAGLDVEAVRAARRALELGSEDWEQTGWFDAASDGGDTLWRDLRAEDWYKPLVPLEAPGLAEGALRLPDDLLGDVVVVTFWASWCEPCAEELPRINRIYLTERERGLRVIGLNARESPQVAAAQARGLGLAFPVYRSTAEFERFFEAEQLPVTAVLDRWGRVRARWSGYKTGVDEHVHDLVRVLLDEHEPPGRPVARVSSTGVEPRVLWTRDAPAIVDGLLALPAATEGRRLLAAAGRTIAVYDERGRTASSDETRFSYGRLVREDEPRAVGDPSFVAFRPGSSSLTLHAAGEEPRRETVPATVFDAASLPRPSRDGGRETLLATLDGLVRLDPAADRLVPAYAAGTPIASVEVVDDPAGPPRVAVLLFGGELRWLDAELEPIARQRIAEPGAWFLLADGRAAGAVAVADASVRAGVAGAFLGGDARQLAFLTDRGEVTLVAADDGAVLFRARWDGATELAAGDICGDGSDELILAAGSRIAVLGFSPIGRRPDARMKP